MIPAVWALVGAVPPAWAAGGTAVVVADGRLRPGRPAVLEVGRTDGPGVPSPTPPALSVGGGTATGPTPVRPGVWRWRLIPNIDADVVKVQVDAQTTTIPCPLPVASSLEVDWGSTAPWVDAVALGEPIRFVVTGDEPLPPDAIEVVAGEGRAVVVAQGDGVAVELTLDDVPHPRWVPVAVRDRRRDELPAWVPVRVKARPRIPMRAEPGAELTLRMGGRTWGPYKAGPDGAIEARIEQLPGENAVSALLTDDLGNRTETAVPLVAPTAPALLGVSEGPLLPGRPPPQVVLWAIGPDGRAPAAPPTCSAGGVRVPQRDLGNGRSLVAVPVPDPLADQRVTCTAGASTVSIPVPVASGVATDLSLRVWPDRLSADDPFAEVSIVLDDARGERMPASGVTLRAEAGTVALDPITGTVARGTYDGTAALMAGADRVIARYVPPPGTGRPRELWVHTGPVPQRAGEMRIFGRVTDGRRRPLPGVPVTLRAGDVAIEAITGADGWASSAIAVQPSPGGDPLVVEAAVGALAARAVAIPGEDGGSSTAELQDVADVVLRAGRVREMSIEVEPSVLRAGPGAVAYVTVRLQDGVGQAVTDEAVSLQAEEGEVGELRQRGDGALVATYTPLVDDRVREVEITASTATLRTSTHLDVEPRVVQLSFGPWVGGHTNFGALNGPSGGLDLDLRVRTPLLGETAVVRLSAAVLGLRSEASTGVGPPVDLRSTVVPLSALLLFRQDRGGWAVWAGGGGTVAPRYTQVRFGDDLVSGGFGALIGPAIAAGVGRRAAGGEIVVTMQGAWLPAPRDAIGYSGNLGGLLGGLGYRLVY